MRVFAHVESTVAQCWNNVRILFTVWYLQLEKKTQWRD